MSRVELQPPSEEPYWRKHRWLRNYFLRARKLCQVDLVARPVGGGGQLQPCGQHQALEVPRWSQWTRVFFYYFTFKLIVVQYLQHEYNQLLDELKQTASTNDTQSDNVLLTPIKNRRVRYLELKLSSQIERIGTLGNPYYELGYALEPTLLITLTINLFVYTLSKFMVSVHVALGWRPIRSSLLGLLQDGQVERGLIASQVHTETENVAVSLQGQPRSFTEFYDGQFELTSWPGSHAGRKSLLADDLSRLVRYGRRVRPYNRQEEWCDQLLTRCAQFVVMHHLSCIPFILIVLVLLPLSNVMDFKLHTAPRDLLFGAELVAYAIFGQQAICFYLTLLFFNSLDQIKYALELDASIGQLAREVQELKAAAAAACQVSPPPAGGLGLIASNLNLKLALMLVHYRLFRGQLKSTQSLVDIAGGITLCLMILMPLLGRTYIGYLDLKQRWLVVFCSLVYVICSDFVIIPNCYLHARCLDVLRHLSSLLAQLVDSSESLREHCKSSSSVVLSLRQQADAHRCDWRPGCVYDEQLIELLRRELRNQQIVMTKFVANAFFLRLTYADLLGVHFWCGLVLGSLLATDLGTRIHATGNLFVDSLVSL